MTLINMSLKGDSTTDLDASGPKVEDLVYHSAILSVFEDIAKDILSSTTLPLTQVKSMLRRDENQQNKNCNGTREIANVLTAPKIKSKDKM